MSQNLAPLAARVGALAILGALVSLGWWAVGQPLVDEYGTARDSLEQSSAVLERYRRIGRELGPLQAQLAALKRRTAAQDGFLQGTNETLAAAQIQSLLKTLVETAHGKLKSTQDLPVRDEGKLRRVTVRAQMSLSLQAAQRVVYGIEANDPLLFVDDIDMQNQEPQSRPGDNDDDPALEIRIDVSGYLRAPGKPPTRRDHPTQISERDF